MNHLHPQTQLPARGPRCHPVNARMELGHGWHSRYPAGVGLVAELRDLVAVGGVDVDEAVHVADAEALDDGGAWFAGTAAAAGSEDGRG